MWFSVALVKFHWFGINWLVFNQSECRNCCLYIIIQKTSKYRFSPDLGRKNGGVLSMRMQVILDSSFARPGSAPIWSGKKGEFRDWTSRVLECWNLWMPCITDSVKMSPRKRVFHLRENKLLSLVSFYSYAPLPSLFDSGSFKFPPTPAECGFCRGDAVAKLWFSNLVSSQLVSRGRP